MMGAADEALGVGLRNQGLLEEAPYREKGVFFFLEGMGSSLRVAKSRVLLFGSGTEIAGLLGCCRLGYLAVASAAWQGLRDSSLKISLNPLEGPKRPYMQALDFIKYT